MTPCHSLPTCWLVTDERQGDAVLAAVARLPRRSGILFRHYSLPTSQRRWLFRQVRQKARAAGHLLFLAGPPRLARAWGADGWHGRGDGRGLHSASVHNLAELRRAERGGAALLFVSPVFPTRSHPGQATLGVIGFGLLARQSRRPVIALGGVGPGDVRRLTAVGAYGWAGVDAWTP